MSTQIYRQGDLGFIPITGLPKNVKPSKSRVIRTGENGGIHAIDEKSSAVMYEDERGTRYVMSMEGIAIVHGEHARVDLPPGAYEVRVQRELGQQGIREVID